MPSIMNLLKRLTETHEETFRATVSSEETGSETTTFYVEDLAGYGDDYFNGEWWIQVVETTDAGLPESQWRNISDYVSDSGKFVVSAVFGADVNTGDNLLFIHEYQYALGARDDAVDYTYSSTTNSVIQLLKGILGSRVIAEGTFTTDSATVPADTSRAEVSNFFDGQIVMPVAGACAFQPRLIVDFNATGDVFTLDAEHPFTGVPGTSAYIIIANEGDLIPGTDAATDTTTAHAVGAKADTADYTYNATTSSLMRLLKGLLGAQIVGEGTFTTSSATVPADTGHGAKANDWFNGCILMPIAGSRAFQPRRIVDFTTTTGVFTVDPSNPFTGVTGTEAYVIISEQTEFAPAQDATINRTPADVIGNKTDSADLTASTKSIVNLLRGLQVSLGAGHAAAGQWEDDGDPDLWDDIVTGVTARNTANRDGALHEKLYSLVSALQVVDAAGTGFEEDGSGATLYKALVAYEGLTTGAGDTSSVIDTVLGSYAADYWNGSLVVMLTGTAAGSVRTIVDFDGTSDLTLEPAMPGASGNGSVFVILTQKCADWIIGADNGNNAFASTNVVRNVDGSVLERLEDLMDDLVGANGVASYPAAAAPGDAVSMAEVLRQIYEKGTKNTMINRDMPYLTEFWETEALNANKWQSVVDAGVGSGEAFAVDDGYMYYDLDTTNAGANDDVLLNSKYRWQARPATFSDTNTSIEKLVLEFEVRVTGTLTNIVEANFVLGLAETKDNDNTDNNLAVFTLDGSGNLIARTDDDGAADEDSSTITATLGNWNKFKIEVYGTGYKFYLNETLEATHTTAVPDEAMYIVFGNRTDGVGGVGLDVANVRAWYEEVV